MKKIEFYFEFDNINEELNYVFDINLSQYGYLPCPEQLMELITNSQQGYV